MTLIRSKRENITILDFSSGKVSKNKIKQSLRNIRVVDVYNQDTKILTIPDNYIKVGMYNIKLILSGRYIPDKSSKHLREYGCFQVSILEANEPINLKKDGRFKSQYWIKLNSNNVLRLPNLTDIIYYCHRLNKLKLFL